MVYARTCQYPLWGQGPVKYGADGTPLFCGEPSKRGSYCTAHAEKCFHGVADQRDAA